MPPDIRILIVADDPLARAGLAALLAEQPGCLVAGRVAGTDDLGAAVEIYRPDVLLWDLGWDPAPALARLAGNLPADRANAEPVRMIAALLSDSSFAAQAWLAGARALLRRDIDPERLVSALAALAQGLAVIDPDFAAALVPAGDSEVSATSGGGTHLIESLTPRELEVLRLMAEGLPNKTIALRLGISEHTVKFHVNAILGKLEVASRTEAVVRATRLGLIFL
jgi:two-component system nitrate/nitrite response regulator NarL